MQKMQPKGRLAFTHKYCDAKDEHLSFRLYECLYTCNTLTMCEVSVQEAGAGGEGVGATPSQILTLHPPCPHR